MNVAFRPRSATLIGAGLLAAAAALLPLVLPVSAQTPPTDPPALTAVEPEAEALREMLGTCAPLADPYRHSSRPDRNG